jgi:hypothetical protein
MRTSLTVSKRFFHAHQLHEYFIFDKVQYFTTRTTDIECLLITANLDVAATHKVANSMHMTERIGNVNARGMSIRVNASCTNHEVVRFKSLSCVKHHGSKKTDMSDYMENDVKFQFVKPSSVPESGGGKEVINSMLESFLKIE